MDMITAIVAVLGLTFLAGGLGATGVCWWVWRRPTPSRDVPDHPGPPTPVEDAATKAYVDKHLSVVPRFRQPKIELYRPEEWMEPLRCNGAECEAPELTPRQLIWLIPYGEQNHELPLCLNCALPVNRTPELETTS